MGKKKPFIDRKNAITFHLVHRSQRDPLAADQDAPQMVLQEAPKKLKGEALKQKKEVEQDSGIYFDDDYDYTQHIKDRAQDDSSVLDRYVIRPEDFAKNKPKGKKKDIQLKDLGLADNLFPTIGEEEEVGLLNKAAPRGLDLSLDPDIVAAMDEDFSYEDPENQLEDDFVMQLMGDEAGEGEEGEWVTDSEEDGSDADSDFMGGRSDDEFDEVPELLPFDEEETKTKFTNYSMSSSVIRRNEGLATLDDKFEKFMDHYDDFDEGALDGEDIEGHEEDDGSRMDLLLKEAAQAKKEEYKKIQQEKEIFKRLAVVQEGAELDLISLEIAERDLDAKWDCESILSTYSNIYNHPKLISERKTYDKIELSSKTGIPKNTLGRGLTAAALKQLDLENEDARDDDMRSVASRISQISIRYKHETKEEKSARKAAVKEFRRERRVEKKANTQAFKDEKVRQEKIFINNKNNMQGNKIL